jgi:hypothetical protein
MKYYFTNLTDDYWVEKNKAYTDAKVVARNRSRIILHESDLETFKKEFQADIDTVNSEYKRCKDLHLFTYTVPNHKSAYQRFSISISSCFVMEIVEVRSITKAAIESLL